jgi:hypothetical protein
MNSLNNSWQCLACHPIPDDVPICRTQKCKRPLTKLGDPWNCWICLNCNDHPDVVNKRKKQTEQPERKYVDIPMTEDRVRQIAGKGITEADVRRIMIETMAEFKTSEDYDPDYPPPRAEIRQMAESVLTIDDDDEESVDEVNKRVQENLQKQETSKRRQIFVEAKKYGVATHNDGTGGMRKKADIEADIAKAREKSDGRSSNIES